MDEKKEKIKILQNLTLDNINLEEFGVEVPKTSNSKTLRVPKVSDKLLHERALALETIKKRYTNSDTAAKIKDSSANKENEISYDSPDLNHTEYEPYRRPALMNLSDLIVEKTIRMKSANTTTDELATNISFEPSEMTGRSTHIHKGQRRMQMSIDEILSTSVVPNVRNLRDSISSSSTTNFNCSKSLPKTADMSLGSSSKADFSFGNIANSFILNNSEFGTESFTSGEQMKSKLIADEISWAQQCAAIPSEILSKDAKEKVKQDGKMNAVYTEESSIMSYRSESSFDEVSLGSYFNKRGEDITDLFPKKSTPVSGTPLVSENFGNSASSTPKIDNKTYSKYERGSKGIENKNLKNHESRDSSLWSISEIDKALARLDLVSSDVHKQNNGARPVEVTAKDLENKENVDPKTGDVATSSPLSDTLSFRDSLLNSSDLIRDIFSTSDSILLKSSPRNAKPQIAISDDTLNEADEEDYSSPIKPPGRRVKLRKSPNDKDNKRAPLVESSPEIHKSPEVYRCKVNKNVAMIDNVAPNCARLCKSKSPILVNKSNGGSPICSSISSHSPNFLGFQSSPRMNKTASPNCLFYNASTQHNNVEAEIRTSREKFEDLRSTSPYSSCSEFSHRSGKAVPIKVTALSISWGSVKLRSVAHKSLQVKNTSNKRLVMLVEVHGPGFQISDNKNTNTITLHPQECRTFTISFCPTVTGVAIGDFSLCSPDNTHGNPSFLSIPLYAFGGHAYIKLMNVLRAPDGSQFLPMGNEWEILKPMQATFKLFNKGTLHGFALIAPDNSSLNLKRDISCFEIRPDRVVIPPNSAVIVRVIFHPKREHLKLIKKNRNKGVEVLGTLYIVSGSEANRQRLRHTLSDIPQYRHEEVLGLPKHNLLNRLWTEFPNEPKMNELEGFEDDLENSNEFISSILIKYLTLTLNFDELNETANTSTQSLSCGDETVIFRSPNPTRKLGNKCFSENCVYADDEDVVSSTQDQIES